MVGTLLSVGCTDNQDRIGESKAKRSSAVTGAMAPEQRQAPTTPAGKQPGKEHGLAADVENTSERMPTGTRPSQANDTTGKRISAEATFVGAPGSKLHGEADLKEVAGGVRINVDVENAPPGPKSLEIYGAGSCTAILGKGAAKSSTSVDKPTELPNASNHRTSALANITVDDDGDGEVTIVVPAVHLEGHDGRSLAQRAIVLHEAEDRNAHGGAGKPIACAVIQPS